jgi:glycerol-3-phosphate acyltransferase PlsX
LKIIVDAFGGDNAPLAVIKGSAMAVEKLNVDIVLCGDEKKIKSLASDSNISLKNIDIIHSDTVIDIHEEPTEIIKSKKNCSMATGLQALADGKGDAFLSAGSTGALTVGATFITKRLKGIKRATLAPILPAKNGYVLLVDGGANVDCRAEMIVQFAVMGSAYMEKVMGISNPRVGLVNVGSEETKGREMEIEAYKQLSKSPINFIGNVEARDIPKSVCDVIVTDGFTGNIILKLYEGMGSFFAGSLKEMLTNGIISKIASLLLLKKIKIFKKKFDYSEVGGAVLMGISKPVIKAHGSSDEKAFFNAIRQAKNCVEGGITEQITKHLQSIKNSEVE